MAIRIGAVNLKKRFVGASEVLISYLGASVIFQSITRYVSNYNTKVLTDGGTVENLTNVTTLAQNLRNNDLFERLTLALFPSGVKASKLYSLFPENGTGDLTVVRNTTATRFNNLGFIENVAVNVPRLKYNSAGGNPFLLIEPQRTNLNLYSNEFSNNYWGKSQSSVVFFSSIINPENTGSFKIVENTSNNPHSVFLTASIAVVVGGTYTRSVFVKAAERNIISLFINNSNLVRAFFNLDTISVLTVNGAITAKIEDFGNGWRKCSITRTSVSTNFSSLAIELSQADNIFSYQGDGVSGAYVFGATIEEGSETSSYIPTVAAAVTRNADLITVAPPAGTVKITTTFSDNTTQILTTIPATFTAPEGLIKSITMDKV
jgi:hypothetical protein